LPEDVVKDSQVRDKPIRGDRGDRGDRDKMEPKIAREGGEESTAWCRCNCGKHTSSCNEFHGCRRTR
jgi:hypothetical protein